METIKKLLREVLGSRILQAFIESCSSYLYNLLLGTSDLETSFLLLLQMLDSQAGTPDYLKVSLN